MHVPSWLIPIGEESLFEMVLLSQQIPLPLILCSHSPADTAVLEPLWSRCVSLTMKEIDRIGLEAVATQFGEAGEAVQHSGETRGRKWQAEFAMVAAVEMMLHSLEGLTWAEASSVSRLPQMCPNFISLLNDESMVFLRSDVQADRRGFVSDGRVIPYHDKLQVCRELLSYLHQLSSREDLTISVAPNYWTAIDEDEYQHLELRDYYYGIPFAREDLNDPHRTGVTIHTRPEPETDTRTHWECMLQKLIRVEFMWSSKQGKKTFHVEEIRSTDQWHYLHAIYDIQSQSFEHLDGAWKVFDPESAAARREPNARFGRPKSQSKIKVFRVDGAFDVEVFSNLVSLFFRNNPLVNEYLAGHTGPSVSFRSKDQGDKPCNRA